MNEAFIPHKERDILENIETEIKNKKKEFFSSIENEDTKREIKNYFSMLSVQKKEYFEDTENGENKFLIEKEKFLSKYSNFNEETFETLIGSIINRNYLIKDIEEKDFENGDNFYGGDLEGHSKEIEELYNKFIEKQGNYNELLSLPREVRIKLCTKAKINIEDVMDGEVGSLTFDFKFGKDKINKEIYLNTTAGQLLPAEVQRVIKDGDTYYRNGQLGEFFTENNKRLTIHQDTHIIVSKLQTREEVLKQRENIKSKLNIESEENLSTEDLIKFEAKLRGIDSDFAILSFSETLEETPEEKREYVLENMLTEFDRVRGIYRLSGKLNKNGKYNDRLALEIFSQFGGEDWKEKAKSYGIEEKYIEDKNSMVKNDINMENIVDGEITQDLIDNISKIKKFKPGSKEAVTLFTIACRIANIDESWATNSHLHKIMSNESGGIVGRLNYTIKGMSFSEYRNRALNSNKNNPIGSKSTASGLGQLLLSNIDKFYPNGRKGIGNPIEEAVGFIRYIEDRYGDPDIAMSVYGKKGSYTNLHTGKKEYKGFKEGY